MTTRRFSIGTPWRLTMSQQKFFIDAAEKDPDELRRLCSVLGITVDAWHQMPAQNKLTALADFEERSAVKALLVKAIEADEKYEARTDGVVKPNKILQKLHALEQKVDATEQRLNEARAVTDMTVDTLNGDKKKNSNKKEDKI